MKTAGFVLTGGHSSRMGRDKALLIWEFRPLVKHIAAQVMAAAGNVALIGEPERYCELGFDCFPDLRAGLGPLAGIEAALETRRGDLNLIVACDMPGLDASWLATLLEKAKASRSPCVVTRDASGIIHPLCAVYRTGCLKEIQSALDSGCLKLHDVVSALNSEIADITTHVWNVNTPEEWSTFQRRRSA